MDSFQAINVHHILKGNTNNNLDTISTSMSRNDIQAPQKLQMKYPPDRGSHSVVIDVCVGPHSYVGYGEV